MAEGIFVLVRRCLVYSGIISLVDITLVLITGMSFQFDTIWVISDVLFAEGGVLLLIGGLMEVISLPHSAEIRKVLEDREITKTMKDKTPSEPSLAERYKTNPRKSKGARAKGTILCAVTLLTEGLLIALVSI